MMKKFLFLGAIAAMLLGTTACSNDMEPELTNGTVQFKVELPGAIESRAIISDGTTATKLDVACYDANGNVLTNLNPVVTPFNERVATVTVKLVKGQKYQFAFFAHADGAPYQFNAGTKLSDCTFSVTDGYTGANCLSNAENRDAFYATLTNYEVTANVTEVTLYRPFAQLNFGTDDLAAAEAAGIIPGQSMVTVKQVATSFNLSTGATTGAVDATFALANLPTDTNEKIVVGEGENQKEYGKLTVENKDYAWMAMNYFLVPNNEANVEVEMTVNTNKQPVTVPVTSVPVKKNHRTNILGSLFTQEGNFKVIIDQNFDTPDNNVEYPEVTNVVTMNGVKYESIVAAYNAALEAGLTDIVMSLAKGTYEIPNTFAFEKPNTKINLTVQAANGVKAEDITINGRFVISSASGKRVGNGSSMTIKGVSFSTTNTQGKIDNPSDQYYPIVKNDGQPDGKYYCIYACGAINLSVEDCIFNNSDQRNSTAIFTWGSAGGTTSIKNCVFNGGEQGKSINLYQGEAITIDGCTFNKSRDYAAQISGYGASDVQRTLVFKNNTINHPDNKLCYGLVLDSRQPSYYNLDITVENNMMTGGSTITWQNIVCNSYLYAYNNADADAWGTVTVNNGKENWGIYYPDAQ